MSSSSWLGTWLGKAARDIGIGVVWSSTNPPLLSLIASAKSCEGKENVESEWGNTPPVPAPENKPLLGTAFGLAAEKSRRRSIPAFRSPVGSNERAEMRLATGASICGAAKPSCAATLSFSDAVVDAVR